MRCCSVSSICERSFEEEHDQRFRGWRYTFKWLMALVLGEVLAIVGFAVARLGAVKC